MRVDVADIRPGDTIVICVPQEISKQQASVIRANAEEQFPGFKVVVLTGGVTLGVMRPAA